MATARSPSTLRRFCSRRSSRRSTPAISLQQNSLLEGVPTDKPEDERLRILLQRCFKRAVEEISNEVEPFQEHKETFLAEGLALLEDTGEDDRLTKLLKSATERPPGNESALDLAVKHNDKLKALTAECKRWNELLSSDTALFDPPDEQCVPEAETAPDQKDYYEEIVRKADEAKRAVFQYASAMQTLSGMRDEDDRGEASGEQDRGEASGEVDEASMLEDV